MTAARALLVVPPFIKYNAGPLLGPALLQAAAKSHGHLCSTLDLNAKWIQRHGGGSNGNKARHSTPEVRSFFQGDHNKPLDGSLQRGELKWNTTLLDASSSMMVANDNHNLLRRLKYGFIDHDEIEVVALRLASAQFGDWVQGHLVESSVEELNANDETDVMHPVDMVGLSLLHAGQVIPAAAISMRVRELWPKALVVWGGPHINGLGQSILEDLDKRTALAADVFVQGHAEQTFVELLDQLGANKDNIIHSTGTPSPTVLKGKRGKFLQMPLLPSFGSLDVYNQPMTLPVQSSLGCAFGRCAFCTYPAMEGKPVQLSLQNTLVPMIERVMELGEQKCPAISFKDSLVTTKRLVDIADCIQGRVAWSACTKLSSRLSNVETLNKLGNGGLATLEIGLESLLPETQLQIRKIQSQELFESFISQAATVQDLSVVVNYMTGFPWEDVEQAKVKLQLARDIVTYHLNRRGKVEHNTFELERLSPMALNPTKYGIREENLKMWPWASVIEQCQD